MSRNLCGFALTAIALLASADCGAAGGDAVQPPPTDTVAKSLTVSPSKVNLVTGGAYGLPSCKQQTASVGVNALNAASQSVRTPEVTWTSSDPSIVSISNEMVKSHDVAGKATVTATATGTNMTASTEVTVTRTESCRDTATAVRVSVADQSPIIVDGTPRQVSAVVFPDSANPSGTWSSSVPDVLKVDDKGLVSALKEGSADICRTTTNNKKGCQSFTAKYPIFKLTPEKANSNGFVFLNLEGTGCNDTSVKIYSSIPATFTSRDVTVLSVSQVNDTTALVTGVSPSASTVQGVDKYGHRQFVGVGVSGAKCTP